jgi:Pilus formation protein N terminal region
LESPLLASASGRAGCEPGLIMGFTTWTNRDRLAPVPSGEFARLDLRETTMRPVFQSVLTAVVLAIAGVAVAGPFEEALAQEPNSVQSSPVEVVTGSVQEILLTMGKGRLFKTSAPYTKLSVADEKIVEVTPQSDREFIFNPKGIGSTNVFIFDAKNMLMANVDINVVSGIAKTQEVHEEAPGNVRVYRSLAKPAFYRCNATNCDLASEALGVESPMDQRSDAPIEGTPPVRRSHAPIGVVTPGGIVIPIYPRKGAPSE